MPTDKPYKVTAKLTQHEKPTRRAPGPNMLVGRSAMLLVVEGNHPHDYLKVLASKDQDGKDVTTTAEGMAMWLALGSYLQETAENPRLATLFQAILGIAHRLMQDPDTVELVAALIGAMQTGLSPEQAEELLQQTHRSSTEGTN